MPQNRAYASRTDNSAFTLTSVHGRYNRCAREIAKREGRTFVKICQRERFDGIKKGASKKKSPKNESSQESIVIKDEQVSDAPSDNAPSDDESGVEGSIDWSEGRIEQLRDQYTAYSGDMYRVLARRLSAEFQTQVTPEDVQRQCRSLGLGFQHLQ